MKKAILIFVIVLLVLGSGLRTNELTLSDLSEPSFPTIHHVLTFYGYSIGVDYQKIGSPIKDTWNKSRPTYDYVILRSRSERVLPAIGKMALWGRRSGYYKRVT